MNKKTKSARPHHGRDTGAAFAQLSARHNLAQLVYETAFQGTESFRENDIGADLAYLLGAILSGGKVDWSPELFPVKPPALLAILTPAFPADSSLWKHIDLTP